jgi:hypothetical protein
MTDINDPEALSRAEQHFGLQSLVDIDELVRPRGEENVYGAVRRVVREHDEALEHLRAMYYLVRPHVRPTEESVYSLVQAAGDFLGGHKQKGDQND